MALVAAGGGGAGETCLRMEFLKKNPDVLEKYMADLLPLLMQVYSNTVTPTVSPMP